MLPAVLWRGIQCVFCESSGRFAEHFHSSSVQTSDIGRLPFPPYTLLLPPNPSNAPVLSSLFLSPVCFEFRLKHRSCLIAQTRAKNKFPHTLVWQLFRHCINDFTASFSRKFAHTCRWPIAMSWLLRFRRATSLRSTDFSKAERTPTIHTGFVFFHF